MTSEFYAVLDRTQEYISKQYAVLLSDSTQTSQLRIYLRDFLQKQGLAVPGMKEDELINALYCEMAEYSIITPYLSRVDVEEININSWRDIAVHYSDGRIGKLRDRFRNPQHSVDVVKKLLHESGMILDSSQPIVKGHLSNKIRVTALGGEIIDKDKGVAVSIRIVNPQKLSKDDFLRKGTATPEMMDFLSLTQRYGIAQCFTGSTGSGKTTLMSWVLSCIPYEKRIITIEDGVREFDLEVLDDEGFVLNNVIHLCTRYNEDLSRNVDTEAILEASLTCNPDIICVAEIKGAEGFAALEAARTGHGVITTTHANSCEDTHSRIATCCMQKYPLPYETLLRLAQSAFPIVVFAKKLEDNSRKIMTIAECETHLDGSACMRTLWEYRVDKGGSDYSKITGRFIKVNAISESLQRRLRENGMPGKILQGFCSMDDPELDREELVS